MIYHARNWTRQRGRSRVNASEPSRRVFAAVAFLLLTLGIAIRVYNAIEYDILWGFDARENWQYVALLTRSWALPAPDAGWSTAHPPFFYYSSASIVRLLPTQDRDLSVIALRLVSSAIGLVMVACAVLLVKKLAGGGDRRSLLAGGLVLFLPAHIYMSAMLSEEILVGSLISLVLAGAALELERPSPWPVCMQRAAFLGASAGLALLTKLSGALVIAAVGASYLLDGWRRRQLAERMRPALLFAAVAALVGGWYYARNLAGWGYLYPHGLEVHGRMFEMPPGTRSIGDYLNIPWATFIDPQVMSPDLLRSIWGTTYASIWFDAHRHFLPRELASVNLAGFAILSLALLPAAAFARGALRGTRRALRSPGGPDTLFTLMIGLTLAGYVLFTWRNPWFAVVKGSFLLGISVPVSYYASEVLDEWLEPGGMRAVLIWCALATLVACVALTFTHHELFWNNDHMRQPGTAWWHFKV
jgi:4-amino-4-deoxy-L-arabinose transferase-like glycosyltransferase